MSDGKEADRRSSGLLRVPFVQACQVTFDDGTESRAFIVNINVLGAYVARDEMPRLGQALVCRFRVPGNDMELVAQGVVAWLNTKQQHLVHSLPPGFGIQFRNLPDEIRLRIEQVIRNYRARSTSTT